MAYLNFYARFYGLIEKIKYAFREVFSYKASFVYLALFALSQVLVWLQAIFIKNNLSGDIVVLHYNINFGIDLVAATSRIYFYPGLAFLVFIINMTILLFLAKHKNLKILVHYLLASAVFFAVWLSLVLLSIYLINFR